MDHVLHDTLSHFMATRASTFAVGDSLDDETDSLFSSLSKGTAWFKQTLASVSLLRKFCASRLSRCVLTVILLSAPPGRRATSPRFVERSLPSGCGPLLLPFSAVHLSPTTSPPDRTHQAAACCSRRGGHGPRLHQALERPSWCAPERTARRQQRLQACTQLSTSRLRWGGGAARGWPEG